MLDDKIHLQLVGENDPAQMRSTFFRYLLQENKLIKFNNFIKVCKDIKSQLAEDILETLKLEISHVGLPDCFNPLI